MTKSEIIIVACFIALTPITMFVFNIKEDIEAQQIKQISKTSIDAKYSFEAVELPNGVPCWIIKRQNSHNAIPIGVSCNYKYGERNGN